MATSRARPIPQTRRSFAGGLAALATLSSAAGRAARASASIAETDFVTENPASLASLIRRAALANPFPGSAEKAAVEGTLARLQGLAFDHTRGRCILANIAAAEVIAFQDGAEVLRSRAIVGAPRTPTPRLTSVVPSVRLNPPWYVPASIAPTIGAATGSFRLVNGTLVQPPGPRNPLGPVRIGLEASDGVYLHGTSDPRLFARERRALSHGCVRVERAVDLAAWVLDMPPDLVRALVATGRTRELVPPDEVRAALAYLTAWPGEDGRLVLHPDPYGLDGLPDKCMTRRVVPRLPQAEPVPAAPADPASREEPAQADPPAGTASTPP